MPASPWFGISLLALAAGAMSLIAGLPAQAVGAAHVPPQASVGVARAMTACCPKPLA